MAAGYDLKEGKYDQSVILSREIKGAFSKFFERNSKKESTYKYAMFKAISDCLNYASDKTYKISFDSLFCRFSEIYWVLVFKHKIPQKVPSINTPETLAEKIINDIAKKNKIRRKTSYSELSNAIRFEMMNQMKKKCSKYVFGALYAETDQLFYSFSKKQEWIKVNPLVVEYINKHVSSLQTQNYQAWARFYTEIVVLGNDEAFYQRLLKREFGSNRIILCSDPNIPVKKKILKKDSSIAKKARIVLQQHPDIGLYATQISEKIGANKDQVRTVLDNSFWSRREGSRYYYQDITDEDIINDAMFQEEIEDSKISHDDYSYEPDEEYLKLLDDPELLIKTLKSQKKESNSANKPKTKKVKKTKEKQTTISTKFMQRKWDREEVVILVVEYFKTKKLSAARIAESQQKVSIFLRKREELLTGHPVDETFRNLAGIRMQSGRIRCLDPSTEYSGMQGTKLQQEVVEEYLAHPKKMRDEAKQIYSKYQ